MRFGFVLPGGSATQQLALAELADQTGWDGLFVWEAAFGIDAWSLLAAMAVRTQRIRLGTLLTPLPWRRPWKVASQLATLDQLSQGRAMLAVGLGAVDPLLGATGEVTDRKQRAQRMDEGLDIIDALFGGEANYNGAHFHLDVPRNDLLAPAASVQRPRPPIWVVGAWPRPRSMARVLRVDGLLPNTVDENGPRPPTLAEVAEMRAWLNQHSTPGRTYELIVEGETPGQDPAADRATVAGWEAAGATWWIEARWSGDPHRQAQLDAVRARLAAGPPKTSGTD